MVRELVQGLKRIRILTTPADELPGTGSVRAVEFRYLSNHPSSYAMLAARRERNAERRIEPIPESRWRDTPADAREEHIFLGLPFEYQKAVLTHLDSDLVITSAAHSLVSSSPRVFGVVTLVLNRVMQGGPASDEAIWGAWHAASA